MPTENILSLEVTQCGWIPSFIQGKHSQIGHYDREKMLKCTHLNYIICLYIYSNEFNSICFILKCTKHSKEISQNLSNGFLRIKIVNFLFLLVSWYKISVFPMV